MIEYLQRWNRKRLRKKAFKKKYPFKFMELALNFWSHEPFRHDKFKAISDADGNSNNKPCGGLWTIPSDSNSCWKEYGCFRKPCSVCSKLSFKGNVLVIDSLHDAQSKLFWFKDPISRIGHTHPLFEPLLENGIDAVWLTEKGRKETDPIGKHSLLWQIESFLILNPNSLVEIFSVAES